MQISLQWGLVPTHFTGEPQFCSDLRSRLRTARRVAQRNSTKHAKKLAARLERFLLSPNPMKQLIALVSIVSLAACGADEPKAPFCGANYEEIDWNQPPVSGPLSRLGTPRHALSDVVAHVEQSITVRAHFAYGAAPLIREDVALFISANGCDYRRVAESRTGIDGSAEFEMNVGTELGHYELRVAVLADGTEASARIHVIQPQQPVVLFDLDGTLTTGDVEVVDGIVLHHLGDASEELLNLAGIPLTQKQWSDTLEKVLDEDAAIYANAVDAVEYYADQGIQPVYITGRTVTYGDMTRRWLERHALPDGPLFLAPTLKESMPMGVKDYKVDTIARLQNLGHPIVAAYGNATTDICAYAESGIAADSTFIVGKHAGEACEGAEAPHPIEDYATHLMSIAQ